MMISPNYDNNNNNSANMTQVGTTNSIFKGNDITNFVEELGIHRVHHQTYNTNNPVQFIEDSSSQAYQFASLMTYHYYLRYVNQLWQNYIITAAIAAGTNTAEPNLSNDFAIPVYKDDPKIQPQQQALVTEEEGCERSGCFRGEEISKCQLQMINYTGNSNILAPTTDKSGCNTGEVKSCSTWPRDNYVFARSGRGMSSNSSHREEEISDNLYFEDGNEDENTNTSMPTESLEALARIQNVIGPYECKLCFEVYETPYRLAKHKCPRLDTPPAYACELCRKSFNSCANLASHKRWHTTTATNVTVFMGDKWSSSNAPDEHQHTGRTTNIRKNSFNKRPKQRLIGEGGGTRKIKKWNTVETSAPEKKRKLKYEERRKTAPTQSSSGSLLLSSVDLPDDNNINNNNYPGAFIFSSEEKVRENSIRSSGTTTTTTTLINGSSQQQQCPPLSKERNEIKLTTSSYQFLTNEQQLPQPPPRMTTFDELSEVDVVTSLLDLYDSIK